MQKTPQCTFSLLLGLVRTLNLARNGLATEGGKPALGQTRATKAAMQCTNIEDVHQAMRLTVCSDVSLGFSSTAAWMSPLQEDVTILQNRKLYLKRSFWNRAGHHEHAELSMV